MGDDPIVFIVDDDEGSAKSVAALMNAIGLESQIFSSAEEFLAKLTETESNGEYQNRCLILDVGLSGMTGVELHEKLSDLRIDIPTIMVSGNFGLSKRSLPEELTCLEKPYPSDRLAECVKNALGL